MLPLLAVEVTEAMSRVRLAWSRYDMSKRRLRSWLKPCFDDEEEADCVDWFENTPYEEQKKFVEEEQRRAESGTTVNGKVVRFGEKKQ